MNNKFFIAVLTGILIASSSFCYAQKKKDKDSSQFEVVKTEEEWKSILSQDAFQVLRKKDTEFAFTGEYTFNKEKGTYSCAGCGTKLFESETKYNSGCGWPSFYEPINDKVVLKEIDKSHGMVREEILCAKCGGHLGHVFNDGPKPTGLRYCINSVSLEFKKE